MLTRPKLNTKGIRVYAKMTFHGEFSRYPAIYYGKTFSRHGTCTVTPYTKPYTTVKRFFFHGQVFQLKFLYQFKSDSTEILQIT